MPQSILITGCAGFIGSNFVKAAQHALPDYEIIGIDDFSSGRRDELDPTITFYEGSITNCALVDKIFSTHKPAGVFHFAAQPRVTLSVVKPVETTDTNITGTIALLDAAVRHGTHRIVFSSSSSVYGNAKNLPVSETTGPPNPQSPYALQKYVGEQFCSLFSQLHGLDTISLRYFNVYGPGQYGDAAYATVLSAWLEGLYFPSGANPFIEGDGEQSRDFCFVEDVCAANLAAFKSTKKFSGEFCNIASGTRTSLNSLRMLIEKETGKKVQLEQRPDRLGDVRHTHADISRAKELIRYEPRVRIDEGIAKTVAWFEERKNKK